MVINFDNHVKVFLKKTKFLGLCYNDDHDPVIITRKNNEAGYWSKRINHEHRIVYKIENDAVLIAQLRYHY